MAKRRKRGDGGISLRKDDRWEGRVVIGYDDKGLPVTRNVLARTKSECIAKLKGLADSIKAPAPDQPKPGILLGDWLDLWYQSYKKPNLRPNTQTQTKRQAPPGRALWRRTLRSDHSGHPHHAPRRTGQSRC